MKNFIRGGRGLCSKPPTSIRFETKTSRSKGLPIMVLILIFCFFKNTFAQSTKELRTPKATEVLIGRSVPDEFWTKEHLFYVDGDTIRRTLAEHKGKMVVLDFWFSGCVPCLLHQKDIKSYVQAYPDDLIVIMVNSAKTKEGYTKINELYRKGTFEKYGITTFESIIEDQYLTGLFPSTSYPHYIWINNLGRLQLKTFRNLLDQNYVAPFIDKL